MKTTIQSIKVILFLVFFANVQALAQQEYSTHFMRKIGQSSFSNPAFMSGNKIGINLPSVYASFLNTGFAANDILFDIPGTDSLRLDFDPIIDKLKDRESVRADLNFDLLMLTYRLKRWQFSLNYGIKSLGYFEYNKNLVDLVWNGNSNYVGQTIDLTPDFQTFSYQEFGFGVAYNLNSRINVGGRVKLLSGIADFSSADPDQLISLTTDDDIYQLTLTTDYTINSAGFPELDTNYTRVNENQTFDFLFAESSLFKNFGFAVDLGVEVLVNERLTLAASIIDFGAVEWSTNLYNYESRGDFVYDGIDLDPLLNGDTLDFSSIGDTLREIFDIQGVVSNRSYTSMLPTKVYLSGQYQFNNELVFNGLIFMEHFRGNLIPGLAVGANYQIGKVLNIGSNFSLRNGRFSNLGLNSTLSLGPVQMFLMSDNVIPLFNPFNGRNFNIRGGLNLVFGRISKPDKG